MIKTLYRDFSNGNLTDVAILRQSVNTILKVGFLCPVYNNNRGVWVFDEFQIVTQRTIGDSEAFNPSLLTFNKITNNTSYNLYYGTINGELHILADSKNCIMECSASNAGIADGIFCIPQLTGGAYENEILASDVSNLTPFTLSVKDVLRVSSDMVGKYVKIADLKYSNNADNNVTIMFYTSNTGATTKIKHIISKVGGRKHYLVSHLDVGVSNPISIVDDGSSIYIGLNTNGTLIYLENIAARPLETLQSPTAWTVALESVESGQSINNYPPYMVGRPLYNNNKKVAYFWDGADFRDAFGAKINVSYSGNSTNRPNGSSIYVGFQYFDTELGKPIYVKAIDTSTTPATITWVDATGTTV